MKKILIKKGTKVLFGNPAKPYPSIWIETFKNILKEYGYVSRAYLLRIAYSDLNDMGAQANPVLLIDIGDPKKWDLVSKTLGEAFLKMREKDEILDIMPFEEDYVDRTIKPFYKKLG